MKLSYFNFWIRNTVLYLFFCVLGMIMVLVDERHQIHEKGQFLPVMFNGAIMFAIAHVQVYIHNNFLYERYFGKRNMRYFLGTVLLFSTYFLINYFTPFTFVSNGEILTTCISIFLIYLVGLGFYYVHKNILERNKLFLTGLIEKDDEIRHLKAQLNPHFLFNNLNNLYAYALEQSPKTPEIILELSGVLRYMLYECKEEFVPLQMELRQLDNFIQLNQLQLEERGEVQWHPIDVPEGYRIAPLILTVFVENAFKHSVSSQNDSIRISIEVKMKDGWLYFRCENTYSEESNTQDLSKGIGLENVRKRLEILYPDSHELTIQKNGMLYEVELSMKLM